jgi:hypothetical protein
MQDGCGPLAIMEFAKTHDPEEDRTRRCHHHSARSCCRTDSATRFRLWSPKVNIGACSWCWPRSLTRVIGVAGATRW